MDREQAKGKLVYRDGSREVWEIVKDGRSIFLAVTPLGSFVCEAPKDLVLSPQGLLEFVMKGGSDAVASNNST